MRVPPPLHTLHLLIFFYIGFPFRSSPSGSEDDQLNIPAVKEDGSNAMAVEDLVMRRYLVRFHAHSPVNYLFVLILLLVCQFPFLWL